MFSTEPIEDTRPSEPPPMSWAELLDAKPDRALAIFTDCTEGNEWECFRAMREDCRCAGIVERMEQRANQETR